MQKVLLLLVLGFVEVATLLLDLIVPIALKHNMVDKRVLESASSFKS